MSSIPQSLRNEHAELHDFLTRSGREPGGLGEAARLVGRILQPHMEKEEAFALPPLGLLPRLAEGRIERDMGAVLAHTEWLKAHMDDVLAEHRMVTAALERLIDAARAAGRLEYMAFAEKLMNHVRMEEEILYPAAILVGEYLKIKLGPDAIAHTAQ